MFFRCCSSLLIIFLTLCTVKAHSQSSIIIPVTDFNPESLENEDIENPRWSELTLPRRSKTEYSLHQQDSMVSIKAVSENSASGLVYKVDIDPAEFPIIEWKWRVDDLVEGGDFRSKKGDDYAARIYITFDYDKSNLGLGDHIKYETIRTFSRFKIPLRAINYIWANDADNDTIAPNAYSNWVMMVISESGNERTSEWLSYSRNIYEDYKTAFGEEPPRINGIAIMTDTDNTKSTASAFYGNIVFHKAN
jgi:hypothetical protein